jgi:hypothetical protein
MEAVESIRTLENEVADLRVRLSELEEGDRTALAAMMKNGLRSSSVDDPRRIETRRKSTEIRS